MLTTLFFKRYDSFFAILIFFSIFYFLLPNVNSTFAQSTDINRPDTNNLLSLPDLFKKVKNSVVQVTHLDLNNPVASRLGSGFVSDYEGHIITNAHVALSNADANDLQVTFLDGKTYPATLVGVDLFTDLAVLKIKDPSSLKLYPLSLGNSQTLEVGETVVAIGNPFGLSGSMTTGIVSGLGRLLPATEGNGIYQTPLQTFSMSDIIQTDAAINPGNSGGPLLNLYGEVIGINTAIFSNTGVYSGVGFAVPSQTIKKVVPSIIKTGTYAHPYIGIVGLDMTPELAKKLNLPLEGGFLVTGITPNSPAEKYGIHPATKIKSFNGDISIMGGDVIIKIDGIQVSKIDSILTYLEREKQVGDKIAITVYRNGEYKEIDLVLDKRPNSNSNVHDNNLTDNNKNSNHDSNSNSNNDYSSDSYNECLKFFGEGICDFIFRN